MTVRRFLVAAALAVLVGAPASVAWAAGVRAEQGGAAAPAPSAPASHAVAVADVARGAATLRAALAKRKHPVTHKSRAKRATNEFAAESTPLSVGSSTKATASTGLGGGSVLRTLGGLLLVVAAIYAVAWVLRRVKRSREDEASGRGLASVATLPLGNARSLHLIRAGSDVILVGSSEQGVTPIQRYTEEEALANGVLSEPGQDAVLREAAGSFMPDGAPVEPTAGGWRPVDGALAASPRLIDALRRLTVRP